MGVCDLWSVAEPTQNSTRSGKSLVSRWFNDRWSSWWIMRLTSHQIGRWMDDRSNRGALSINAYQKEILLSISSHLLTSASARQGSLLVSLVIHASNRPWTPTRFEALLPCPILFQVHLWPFSSSHVFVIDYLAVCPDGVQWSLVQEFDNGIALEFFRTYPGGT